MTATRGHEGGAKGSQAIHIHIYKVSRRMNDIINDLVLGCCGVIDAYKFTSPHAVSHLRMQSHAAVGAGCAPIKCFFVLGGEIGCILATRPAALK